MIVTEYLLNGGLQSLRSRVNKGMLKVLLTTDSG
jgi:hypothetical protein